MFGYIQHIVMCFCVCMCVFRWFCVHICRCVCVSAHVFFNATDSLVWCKWSRIFADVVSLWFKFFIGWPSARLRLYSVYIISTGL